jgi:carbon storage regulator
LRAVAEATIVREDRDPQYGDLWKRLKEEGIMLVLSRKLGQSFHVGDDVRITIVKIDRNSVRIGILAPDEVSIQREEIAFEVPEPRTRSYEAGAA